MTVAKEPAYPTDEIVWSELEGKNVKESKDGSGLTKREYFAAMALSGSQGYEYKGAEDPKDVAIRAIQIADHLIAELNKETK